MGCLTPASLTMKERVAINRMLLYPCKRWHYEDEARREAE